MRCDIIRDLIPLYLDDCCSEESAREVKAHIEQCDECRALSEEMKTSNGVFGKAEDIQIPKKLIRVNNWRASILQSALFLISFAIITVGVALEAATPLGFTNGLFAINSVVPATGFMLSLTNWYFLRLYKSKRAFSNFSLAATALVTAVAYIWARFHYGDSTLVSYFGPEVNISLGEALYGTLVMHGIGIVFTVICCVLSKLLSDRYAELLGKE